MRSRTLRSPPVAAEGKNSQECPGGREEARGAVFYTSQLRIGAWNCGGVSKVTMTMDLGFDILALYETHKWRSDTDTIFSEQAEVLLNCVTATHQTLFPDVPNLSIENATKMSKGEVAISPHCVTNLYQGELQKKVSK